MQDYQADFITFLLETGALTFGDFTTKSGRKTPFFLNTGLYRTGSQLTRLGDFYAEAILARLGTEFDVLFGPAYKGIPLVVTTAQALAHRGQDVAFCFDRKEAKDHGEGGLLVGHKLRDGDRVLIVEDVTTAGTSIRESVPKLRAAAKISLAGLVVSVDRQERGQSERAALTELADEFAMPTFSIVNLDQILSYLRTHEGEPHVPAISSELWKRIEDYRLQYGAE
ncbi:MAG: orotate phosphoribosyltransferase [Planctomycetes bacterium]|nr:orotate phosphoribosyltransferase [Planctomycetota bacterium]MCB9908855.1 orotate phosphoribosyltransferase [Planctomycetota bacterium]HRV81282.1 orotate phosphoribosyltransferase [Planctomycetota bacterium]